MPRPTNSNQKMIKQINHSEGLIAAPFTPMDSTGKLDLSVIPPYANWLADNGLLGVFVCGTTGEGPSLSTAERMQVAAAWAKSKGNLRLIVHVGHNSLPDARMLAEHAQSIHADAIGCMPPQFFKPNGPAEVSDCCGEVASAAPDTPFYYYHIPSMSGVEIKVANLIPVMADRVPTFAGVKFTYEDLDDYKTCLEYDGGHYDILFGRDEKLLSAVRLGAMGAVGSTYNFAAPLYLNLIDSYLTGDLRSAEALQNIAVNLIDTCIKGPWHPIAAFKQLMQFVGVDCGPTRLPIPALKTDESGALRTLTIDILESDQVRKTNLMKAT